MSITSKPAPAAARTYAEYARPAWRRLLLTRETAVVALLVAVVVYSLVNVPNFDGPLTLTYLLLDITPILLIALPMTLVIITAIVLDRVMSARQARKLLAAREQQS